MRIIIKNNDTRPRLLGSVVIAAGGTTPIEARLLESIPEILFTTGIFSFVGAIPAGNVSDVIQIPPVYDETVNRLLLPPKVFLDKGKPLPLYKSSILASYGAAEKFRATLISVPDATYGFPVHQTFSEQVLLDSTKLPATFRVGIKQDSDPKTFYYGDITKIEVDPTTKSGKVANVLMFGDSLTNRDIGANLKTYLTSLGVNITGVGTITSNAFRNEAREGWEYSNFVGFSNIYINNQGVIALQASGVDSTLQQNPFLKLATSGDKSAHPDWCFRNTGSNAELSYQSDPDKTGNFYIFDFANYLANHGVANPDIVTIALSTNDIYTRATTYLANCKLALKIMVSQIKAALPNTKIGIIPSLSWSSPNNDKWTNKVSTWIENCLVDVAVLQGSFAGLDIVPVWAHMSKDWIYAFDAVNLNSLNNTKKATLHDVIHWDTPDGKWQYVQSLYPYILNVLP